MVYWEIHVNAEDSQEACPFCKVNRVCVCSSTNYMVYPSRQLHTGSGFVLFVLKFKLRNVKIQVLKQKWFLESLYHLGKKRQNHLEVMESLPGNHLCFRVSTWAAVVPVKCDATKFKWLMAQIDIHSQWRSFSELWTLHVLWKKKSLF